MKKILLALGLLAAVAGAVSISGNAGAQTAGTNTVERNGYYFNATTGAKTNESGSQHVTETNPDRDANLTFSSIISNTALASGAGDSSAVLDTHDMRLGMLLFKITPSTGTGTLTRLAVQVRVHLNGGSDSTATFPIYFNAFKDAPAVVSAAVDTANSGHQLVGSATAPWSGEFVVTASSGRNSPGSAVAATVWSYPNGIAIPLNNIFGREVYAPYISVRVRNIVGPTAAVTVHLVGTPL